ncbi:EAL domain-containing protein [Methyloglobulus sp.]|uniref:two-component system response regulator n=1 Tax=Methyloglobulus sp. TaxID=2518622 RepID=UPI00398A3D17
MNYPDTRLPVILLIDDDQTLHLWANRSLSDAGFKLISCFDGKEGIKAFREHSPNIVMIDIEMPNLDGIQTCTEIRHLPNAINTPVIMMTVTEDPQRIAQSYSSGATDFVVKPINWEVLVQRLLYMVKANNNLDKLAQSELRLSKAKKMARLGDWEWQADNEILYWSDEIYTVVELDKHEFIPNTDNFKEFIHPADLAYVIQHLRKVIKTKEAGTIEFRIITSRKQERFVSQQTEAITNHKGLLTGLIGTVQDISERKGQENKIRHLAYYDEVTQLPNRHFFLTFLAKTIAQSDRNSRKFAILFLDLDGFKGINDTYGHHAGDLFLKEISTRLTDGLRCSDLASRYYFDPFDYSIDVARLGGDEFIILLNDLAHPKDAVTVAERIQRWIAKPVALGDRLAHISVSIGIAVFPHDGEDSETLLKNADIAMYHAKKMGKGYYQFFHETMALKAKKRLEMETHMHHAVANNELRLHYQPVVEITSCRLIGAEALLRWDSPQLGFLPPNDFISLAEENGVIIQFGEWALREVCRQYKAWQQQGLGDLTIAVNLSSLQFNQSSFIPMVADIIQEFEVNPTFLTFELTESMIMSDTDNMLEKLNALKSLGIKLALDDFGTGYSSLRYLNRFPLDSLKIDRSFVKELPDSLDAAAIVGAILALAQALNLNTVAEGVETQQQNAFLQNTSCNAVQGYFFSKPMPVAEFEKYWAQKIIPPYKPNLCLD